MPATGTEKAQRNAGSAGFGRFLNIGVGALFLTRERMEHLFSEWEQEGTERLRELEKRLGFSQPSGRNGKNGGNGRHASKKKTVTLSKKEMDSVRSRS